MTKSQIAANERGRQIARLNSRGATPGPWHLGAGYKTADNHAICDGPQILAKVNGFGYPAGEGWSPESEANAQLMCAAPELLAALRSVRCTRSEAEWEAVAPETHKIMLAAIAKAEGSAA